MRSKLEYIQAEPWHRIIKDLEAAAFTEVYQYAGDDRMLMPDTPALQGGAKELVVV